MTALISVTLNEYQARRVGSSFEATINGVLRGGFADRQFFYTHLGARNGAIKVSLSEIKDLREIK
jgi:hypothetical protein